MSITVPPSHPFLPNKYTIWYFSIISRARCREMDHGYYERHHVIPYCFYKNNRSKGQRPGSLEGDANDNMNIVQLTAKEHFICHWLLTKMVEYRSTMWFKMEHALSSFSMSRNANRNLTAREYERVRIALANSKRGKPMTTEAKQKLSMKAKERCRDPEYRKVMSEAQLNRPPVSNDTRKKLSIMHKGVKKTPQHAKAISIGLQKLYKDPAMRQKRSEQAKTTNARPEVRQKISEALTGIKRSDEVKQKVAKAAKIRCQNPDYLKHQSESQKARWQQKPQKWWNNGDRSCRSVKCPGEGWEPGRAPRKSN